MRVFLSSLGKASRCAPVGFKRPHSLPTITCSRHLSLKPSDNSGKKPMWFEQLKGHVSGRADASFLTSGNKRHLMKLKFQEVLGWYEEYTGILEVRQAQDRVIEAQDRFAKAQEKRRQVMSLLTEQQAKLKEIYADMETTSRGEERYLNLITKEHALLREEKKTKVYLDEADREERDSFLALTTFVKESHSKEKAQSEKTKYWSIIGSIIGTILGVFGSSITNGYRMKELKMLIQQKYQPSERVAQLLSEYETFLSKYMEEAKRLKGTDGEVTNLAIAKKLETALLDIKKSVNLASFHDEVLQSVARTNLQLQSVEAGLHYQTKLTKELCEFVVGCAVIYVGLSIVTSLFFR